MYLISAIFKEVFIYVLNICHPTILENVVTRQSATQIFVFIKTVTPALQGGALVPDYACRRISISPLS